MEETLGDAVGILFMVNMLVMTAVFASPQKRGIFKSSCSKYQREKPHHPMPLECKMREKPVIADRDRKSAGAEHHREKHDLESVESEEKEVSRYGCKGKKQGPDKKRADKPVDFIEWNTCEHKV